MATGNWAETNGLNSCMDSQSVRIRPLIHYTDLTKEWSTRLANRQYHFLPITEAACWYRC